MGNRFTNRRKNVILNLAKSNKINVVQKESLGTALPGLSN